ncbi:MAG: CaiB/BaiF CoA transferase family protein [Gammaproteobacteria bacterium]
MPGPLQGFRVVDCTRGMAGTRAAGILADYGAEVIRVEPPGGDPWRGELAVAYAAYNRGKRSVELDLKTPAGHAGLRSLLADADVLMTSWRPGVTERLGLGHAALHADLPQLVTCEITGFGADGPFKDLRGYEALVHAVIGTMGEQMGYRDGPIYEGLPFAGLGASSLAVIGTLAALLRRETDGHGRHVETTLLDGALAYLTMAWSDFDVAVPRPVATGNKRIIVRTFKCADGHYVGIHTGAVGAFGRTMQVLGLADRVAHDERGLDMAYQVTPEEYEILQNEVPKILETQPRAVWVERLLAADVCVIPVLHPTEIFDERQVRHNAMVITVDDPVLGRVEQAAPPARFSNCDLPPTRPAARSGEHDGQGWQAPRRALPALGSIDRDKPLLAGVKIVDAGAYYAGPYAPRLLADFGAEVVKIETLGGDPLRGQERVFPSGHANKRSIAIDMKRPEAAAILNALVKDADVVTQNMRPGAAERLGVGYEQLKAIKPDLIYAWSAGWGASGPDYKRQGFAPMYSGYTGISFEVAGRGNPPIMPVGNEDPGNGLLGAIGILMALLHRARTGEGQLVDHFQINATMGHMAHVLRRASGEVLGAARLDQAQMGVGPFDRLYRTRDGWLCIVAGTEAERAALCRALEVARDAGSEHAQIEALAAAAGRCATADLGALLKNAGVPHAVPVPYNCETFLSDPENRRTLRAVESRHLTRGRVREVGKLIRVSGAAIAAHRPAPELGEHTDEILAEAGFDAAAVRDLRAAKVVR